jgi:hypothetical protein
MRSNLLLALPLCLIFLSTSCKSNKEQSTPPQDTSTTTNNSSSASGSSNSSCDDFLNEYEQFTNDYLNAVRQYSNDPTNASLLSAVTDYSQKTQTWVSRWTTISQDCASDPSFAQKYLDITNRITAAASDMYK